MGWGWVSAFREFCATYWLASLTAPITPILTFPRRGGRDKRAELAVSGCEILHFAALRSE